MRILTKVTTLTGAASRVGSIHPLVRLPLFFGGCGVCFSTLSWFALCVRLSAGAAGRGLLLLDPASEFVFTRVVAWIAACGAIVGAGCSVIAVPTLRRKRIGLAALWLVPVHCVLTVVASLFVIEPLVSGPLFGYGRWVHGAFPSASFVLLYLFLSARLPNVVVLGCCDGCGYNLTGNVSGVCPECGRGVDPEERTA